MICSLFFSSLLFAFSYVELIHIFFFIKTVEVEVLVPQLCPTLHELMDGSPPGSSVHGISQARILERVVISSSKGFS